MAEVRIMLIGIPIIAAILDLMIHGNTQAIIDAGLWTAVGALMVGGILAGLNFFGTGLGDVSVMAVFISAALTIFYVKLIVPMFNDLNGTGQTGINAAPMIYIAIFEVIITIMFALGLIFMIAWSHD